MLGYPRVLCPIGGVPQRLLLDLSSPTSGSIRPRAIHET